MNDSKSKTRHNNNSKDNKDKEDNSLRLPNNPPLTSRKRVSTKR